MRFLAHLSNMNNLTLNGRFLLALQIFVGSIVNKKS